MRLTLAATLTAMLVAVTGFFGQWIPSLIPPEWAEITPLEWEPPGWEDTSLAITDPAEPLDPDTVPGFLPQRIMHDDVGVQARFLLTPDRSSLNDLTLERVRTEVAAQAQRRETTYSPQAHDTVAGLDERGCVQGSTLMPLADLLRSPELAPPRDQGLAVTCDIMSATGPLLVQRVRTVVAEGEDAQDTVTTLLTDTVHNHTVTGLQLWAPEAQEELWAEIIGTLRHEAGSLSLMPVTSTPDDAVMREILGSAIPMADGSVQFVVPAGFTVPELQDLGLTATEAPFTLTLAESDSAGLLSGAGHALIATVQDGGDFSEPPFLLAGHRSVDCSLLPCVALTYDDGPSPLTMRILDALAAGDAGASFFMLGEQVEEFPDIARRVVNEGHLALNHSWSHVDLADLEENGPIPDDTETDGGSTPDRGDDPDDADDEPKKPSKEERQDAVRKELTRTSDLIEQVTGEAPNAFRPPYGELNAEVLKIANMPAIQWDVDTEDWKGISAEVLISRAVTEPKPGSIVLQHDIHENTASTVTQIIEGLSQRGFTVVNLRQLFGEMPTDGEWHSAR